MSVDNIYDKLVVTRAPIKTDKPSIQPVTDTVSSLISTPRTVSTSGLSSSGAVTVVVTR